MPVKRTSPLGDTAFQERSRERLTRLKNAERGGKYPVSTRAGKDAQQLADRESQKRGLKKSGDI